MNLMPAVTVDEDLRKTVRAAICPACAQRPAGSEALPYTAPRICEPRCAVFRHLGQLKEIADGAAGGSLGRYELTVRQTLCDRDCTMRAPDRSRGEPCHRDVKQICALCRFSGQVLQVLESLAHPGDCEASGDRM